jgi:hypothetical protein
VSILLPWRFASVDDMFSSRFRPNPPVIIARTIIGSDALYPPMGEIECAKFRDGVAFPSKDSWRNWIILVFIPFVSLVDCILVIVAVKGISDELQVKKIFDNVLIAAVTGIVVVAIAGASVIVFGTIWAPLASGSSWTPTRTGLMAPQSEAPKFCTSCGSSRMSASDMFCINRGAKQPGY